MKFIFIKFCENKFLLKIIIEKNIQKSNIRFINYIYKEHNNILFIIK